jgi:hypothetical protein
MFNYSDTWQLVINTGTTIVTFLMVFLIQNTQNRDAAAVQLKLDELIRASSSARNRLLTLEDLSEKELDRMKASFAQVAAQGGIGEGHRRRAEVDLDNAEEDLAPIFQRKGPRRLVRERRLPSRSHRHGSVLAVNVVGHVRPTSDWPGSRPPQTADPKSGRRRGAYRWSSPQPHPHGAGLWSRKRSLPGARRLYREEGGYPPCTLQHVRRSVLIID